MTTSSARRIVFAMGSVPRFQGSHVVDAIEPAADPALAARIAAAARAFGAPLTVEISNRGDPRTSTATAVRAGLVTVGTELGGGGTVTPAALALARAGVRRVLAHLGILADAPPPEAARVVPGHGPVAATLAEAAADETAYLGALRDAVRAALDAGQGLSAAVPAVAAALAPLAPAWADFDATTARNAAAAYAEMEWD